MAAPTAPTVSTLVSAALADAGYANPATALTAIAEGLWLLEIKNLIWAKQKRLKCLQKTAVGITTIGVSRYANPSDFSSDLKITLLSGDTGTAQTGASGSVTLQSGDSIDVGKELLITAGTGAGSLSQVSDFDTSTLVATVSPNWPTAPAASSTYMKVSRYAPLIDGPAWDYDALRIPTTAGEPTKFYALGDEDHGEFVLDKAPDKAYGMRNRYYANLMNLDVTSTTHATFLLRFQSVLSKGIFSKALKRKDDTRWLEAESDFLRTLDKVCDEEKYGSDNSTMTQRINDFF